MPLPAKTGSVNVALKASVGEGEMVPSESSYIRVNTAPPGNLITGRCLLDSIKRVYHHCPRWEGTAIPLSIFLISATEFGRPPYHPPPSLWTKDPSVCTEFKVLIAIAVLPSADRSGSVVICTLSGAN